MQAHTHAYTRHAHTDKPKPTGEQMAALARLAACFSGYFASEGTPG